MSKLRLVVLLLGLLLIPSSEVYAKTFLDQAGCKGVAQAAGLIQLYVNEGSLHAVDDIIGSQDPKTIDPSILTHLKYIEIMACVHKGADPQDHMQDYYTFCMAAGGDIEYINELVKKNLNLKDV